MRESTREVENLVIEDIEDTLGIVPGDFRRAVNTMWFTVANITRTDYLYDVHVPKFGRFHTSWSMINRYIKRELRYKSRDRSKLEALFRKRRWMVDSGMASKTYYLRKKMCNGRCEDERGGAKRAFRILQSRLEGFCATGH